MARQFFRRQRQRLTFIRAYIAPDKETGAPTHYSRSAQRLLITPD
jgi:hypothetical protein